MSDFDYGDEVVPEAVPDPEEPIADILDDEEVVVLDDEEGIEFDENDTLDISLGDDEIEDDEIGDDEIEDPEATPRY